MAFLILLISASRLLLLNNVVTIGFLFGGNDLMVDTSNPDKTLIAIVLGIGVADKRSW